MRKRPCQDFCNQANTPAMSDTPETDAEEAKCEDMHHVKWGRTGWDFASRMERERNEAREQLTQSIGARSQYQVKAIRAENQLAESRAQAEMLMHCCEVTCEHAEDMPWLDHAIHLKEMREALAAYRAARAPTPSLPPG